MAYQVNDQNRHSVPLMQTSAPARGYAPDDDEINLRELFDIVWSGKWLVFWIVLAIIVLSVAYAVLAQPIYQARGLVQVEQEKNSLNSSVDQLNALIGGSPTEASAEIALIKSNLVLGSVVDSLKLYIYAEPDYFPVVGKGIVRLRGVLDRPAAPLIGFEHYAWGGERIRITALDLPEAWHDQMFELEAKDNGKFSIYNGDDQLVMSGTVGERCTVNTPDGTASIFVQELVARPGTDFQFSRIALPTILARLADQFDVTEDPKDSGVLTLQFEADDRKFAAQFVNAIEDAYLAQNVERRSAQAAQSLEFLKQQLPELRSRVDEAQAKLNSYQLQKGSVDVQQETQLVLKQAVDLETQRLDLVQKRDAALQRYTAQHPVVVTLNEQIHGIEREQASLKKQVEALPETQQEILSLMRDLEVNTQLYTALLNSAQELQVTKAGTVGNVRIVDRGIVPMLPVKPNKKLVVALGMMFGLLVGLLTVFAMRALLRGVDRPEEIERVIGLPTYASIPYSPAQKAMVSKLADRRAQGSMILAASQPNELAIEALRSLRTSLHFAMMEASNNIIMFTGPVAALGKSFVSINLGAVLAMSGKRILVIDADMRRGQLHRYTGVQQKPGLSDYIVGTADEASIIQRTTTERLDFVSGGTRPPNPSEILMSDRFSELLKKASKYYDYVLIDTPPVLPVTDAAIIGRLASTTLIVLKAAEHPMRAIEETVRRLQQAGVNVRGMIFNQVGARLGSYGYGTYGYAYGYSSYGYASRNGKSA